MYEKEQVPEEEGRKYAEEIGAIFGNTSASDGSGIKELFRDIGCKILNICNTNDLPKDAIKLEENKKENKKKRNLRQQRLNKVSS